MGDKLTINQSWTTERRGYHARDRRTALVREARDSRIANALTAGDEVAVLDPGQEPGEGLHQHSLPHPEHLPKVLLPGTHLRWAGAPGD